MNTSKAQRNLIAIMIGLVVIGLITHLTNVGKFGSGFWKWAINSKPPVESDFIADRAQSRVVDLTGEWYFATGDDQQRAKENFDHSDWNKLRVPSYWEEEGYEDYNGFAWYRREFNIGAQVLQKPLFLLLGRIDDTDEVFINGHRVGGLGQFPPTYVSAWNQQRTYAIPGNTLREGVNVIAVRVYDAQMGGGFSDGGVGIYASNLPQPLVNLHGEWRFKTGDQEEWKNADLENDVFEPIQVPAAWEDQGYSQYDGFAWYRKTFPRPGVSSDETLVLLLGKIDDTDEVFLNGEAIGRTGRLTHADRAENPDYYDLDRRYEFPASLLRKESNTLAVRIHDSGGNGGIYTGPVGIMTKSAYRNYQEQLRKATSWDLKATGEWLLGRH